MLRQPSGPRLNTPAPPRTIQFAADNQRENKIVRDIVVQLGLDRCQQQLLHREISGMGYTYHEILQIAREMFCK
jgi:hypothetical protein